MFERKLIKPTAPPCTAQNPNSASSLPLKTATKSQIILSSKYDVAEVHDSLARPSKHFDRADAPSSSIAYVGDNQTWVEKVLMSTTSCEPRSFFVSKTTDQKVPDEPPTGASRVLYLRDSFRERQKREIRKNGKSFMKKFCQHRKEIRKDDPKEKPRKRK
jgi:hypothetical protein